MQKRNLWLTFALAGIILGSGLTAAAQGQNQPKEIRVEEREVIIMGDATAASPGDGTFVFVSGQGGTVSGGLVKAAPYSAEGVTESIQTLADGNRIVKRNSTLIYRDAEGRTRRETTLKSLGPWASAEEPARMISIFDPVAGVTYSLNSRNRTATKFVFRSAGGGPVSTMTITGAQAAGPGNVQVFGQGDGGVSYTFESGSIARAAAPEDPNRPKVERRREDLGTQTVEGVNAKGTRNVTIYPVGYFGNERPLEVVDESWYSPELKTTVMTKRSDPRTGETTYRLTNINRSNPDRSLFEPPSDYKIEEPKVRTTFNRRMPAPPPPPAAPAKPQQ
jgi:hypothetical protein